MLFPTPFQAPILSRWRHLVATLLISLVAAAGFGHAATGDESAANAAPTTNTFEQIVAHYEVIRLSLLGDNLDGVALEGNAIATLIADLESDWSPERAGVHADVEEDALRLLPLVREAANDLQSAETLLLARDAFYELSVPMVALRKAAEGATSIVAYCPMVDRSWLQPKGSIGNPYLGQEMATCGTVLEE